MGIKSLPDDILNAVETLKGGKGSGNWGHGGLAGVHGGSSPTKGGKNIIEMGINEEDKKRFYEYVRDVAGKDWHEGFNDDDIRPKIKDDIVTKLSNASDLTYKEANELVRHWSVTSNKTMDAYLIQKSASKEFGVPLSPWQKARFKYYDFIDKEYHNVVEEFANECIDTFSKTEFSEDTFDGMARKFALRKEREIKDKYGLNVMVNASFDADKVEFSISNMNVYNDRIGSVSFNLDGVFGYSNSVKFNLDAIWGDPVKAVKYFLGENNEEPLGVVYSFKTLPELRRQAREQKENIRKFVRAVYDNTQETLKKIYPDATHIEVFRGVKGIKKDTPKTYHSNAIEAWTVDSDVCGWFGEGSMRTIVPIEKIYSTCLSGVGCLTEFEFVILGGDYDYERWQ